MKVVNDKITNNIDIFVNEQKYNEKIKALEIELQKYKETEIRLDSTANREKE